jgi:ABC-type transport system involved in multi-copper enzyme maturation permease subunit
MILIHYVRSIALYETKTLLRSWFFRIFAIISVVFLSFFNFGVLLQSNGGSGEWQIKGLPSIIPYVNLLFLNVVQAVIAIFLASDFLKRDKKLDTTEVIYMRPMTNGEYVAGKTLGNLVVFIILNLLILVVALIFNLITQNISVNWIAYLWYFTLISVPTLIFIMGLSFFIMSLIRNQAVTFIVLLGYVAISLFYLQNKFYYLFDYMSFSIPMTFSDFVGFGDLNRILIHRGMYFFLGLAFIFYTIILLRRLPNSAGTGNFSLVFGSAFLFLGAYLGYNHVASFYKDQHLRTEMLTLNDQYSDVKQVDVTDYRISIQHLGETIACETTMDVENKRDEPIRQVIFSLNPGLILDKVSVDGKDQSFSRQLNLIELKGLSLDPGEKVQVVFSYRGSIDEAACYLDVDDEDRMKPYRNMMYQIDKRYAFIMPDYLLLTRENNWYPIPGAGFGHKNTQWLNRQFSNYQLTVTTRPGLTVISQGIAVHEKDQFTFTSPHPQSQISVVIGDYEQIQTKIDGLDFNVYVKRGHDYFSEFFEEIKDTVPAIVSESLQDFERSIDLYYPFERLSLVEVPIQFYSYERTLSGAREQIQPEMILYTEKGVLIGEADFVGRMNARRGFGPQREENLTPREKKINVLQNFLSTFKQEQGRPDISRTQGQMQVEEKQNPFYAFPLFYNYAHYIRSDRWAVTDRVFESYKKKSSSNQGMGWMREMQGMSEDEQANLALLSYSFEEILNDPEQKKIIDNVIQLKGSALFSIIKRRTEDETFEDFLYEFFNQTKFKTTGINDFNDALMARFGIDLIPYMENWFSSKELPAFLIGNVNAVNVLDGDQMKTMVKFKISNTEKTEGIVSVDFRLGGGFGGRFGGMGGSPETISKLIHLEGNQTKEVSLLLNGTPRGGGINTFTSKNIPSQIRFSLDNIEEDKKAVPFEGEKIVDTPVRIAEDNEIIVDNEDPYFTVDIKKETSLLRRLLVAEEENAFKYSGFSRWRQPRSWTLTTNSGFYGAYIRSAYYIRSGTGDQKAIWNVPIAENGYYDVYIYIYKDSRGFGRRGGDEKGEYNYIVHHDDGEEGATIDIKSAEAGWNHLGAFYFSPDTAVIEMTDKSQARMVVADAVKLIKQQ